MNMKADLGVAVNCHRCGGVMAYEKFHSPHEYFWGWRCISCGEIVDEVILENRHWTKTKGESTGRKRELIAQKDNPKSVRQAPHS